MSSRDELELVRQAIQDARQGDVRAIVLLSIAFFAATVSAIAAMVVVFVALGGKL